MSFEMKGAIMYSSQEVHDAQKLGEEILVRIIGNDSAQELIAARKTRDGDKAHITLVGPKEAKEFIAARALKDNISKSLAEKSIKEELSQVNVESFTVKGLGHVTLEDKEAYFVVIDWPSGLSLREKFGLNPQGQDFHITVGFKNGDVHGVRKDKVVAV